MFVPSSDPSLLYVLVLKALLRKLRALRGIPHELGHEKAVSAYGGESTFRVLNNRHTELVVTALKVYEAMTGVKINHNKLVNFST